jgi:uncharacterized protein (TIGR02001 family)
LAADAPASPHTVAFNVGVTTDYIFRGITQTQHDPAISGGVDYSHASGLYAGAWLSNQKWVETGGTSTAGDAYKTDSNLELDFYGGCKGSVGDIGYDVGLIRYYYPGDKVVGSITPDTTEVYVAGTWKMLTLKYSHVVSDYFIGWSGTAAAKTSDSNYLELNATHDLGDGWGLLGHIGHQKVKHDDFNFASYTDWKIGVTKDVGFGVVTAAYSDTDADDAAYGNWDGENVAKGVLALSFSKSF